MATIELCLVFFRQRKTDDYTFIIYVAIGLLSENYGVGTVNSLYFLCD